MTNSQLVCQSHYREVAQWEIFVEQELRFGLDLDQFFHVCKNIGLRYINNRSDAQRLYISAKKPFSNLFFCKSVMTIYM